MGHCIKNERSPLLAQNEVRAGIFHSSHFSSSPSPRGKEKGP